MEINKKMDIQVASLKTVLESLKLETVRYLAGELRTNMCREILQLFFPQLNTGGVWQKWGLAMSDCFLFLLLLSSNGLLLPRHRPGSLPSVEVNDLYSSSTPNSSFDDC